MTFRPTLLAALLAIGCATAPPSPTPTPPPTPTPAHASPSPTAATPAPAAFAVTITGHGPPIVFLPGLSSPGAVYDAMVAHLSSRHTCYVLTLAGFAGLPPLPGSTFLTAERDAILGYLRAHHIARPVIVGHSLGGFLAYALAIAAPDEIAGILAIDGVPFLPALADPTATPEATAPGAAQVRDQIAGLDHAAFARQTRSALRAMITAPAEVDRVSAPSERSDPRTVGRAIYELMTTDLRAGLAAVRAPVWLILAGDAPGMRAAYEAQVAHAPDHRVIVAPEARHFVMLDDPGLVDATLDALLAAVRR